MEIFNDTDWQQVKKDFICGYMSMLPDAREVGKFMGGFTLVVVMFFGAIFLMWGTVELFFG